MASIAERIQWLCLALFPARMAFALVFVVAGVFSAQAVTIFTENMGTSNAGNTLIAASTFQNSGTYTYSGSTETRNTGPSTGYTGASGIRNVWVANNIGRYFQMEGINTSGYTDLSLSFGALKSGNTSNLTALVVECSTDGISWTTLTFPPQATGNGTAIWRRITITGGTIPATSNLRLRWTNSTTADSYRIDDITLTGDIAGPTVTFAAATSSALESDGTVAVNMNIAPAAAAAGTITITMGGSGTATYGATNDYTTSPVGPTTFTVPVVVGQTSASFNVIINDDALTEADETIAFSISAVSSGLFSGSPAAHLFTIVDNDYVPSVEFGTLSISALEGSGPRTFTINLSTPHPAGTVTITANNGPGVNYGALPNDYTTSLGAGPFTISFAANVPSVTFQATAYNDGLAESTETVTFTITGVTGAGMVIGSNTNATFIIGDINSPPALFSPGDLAVVGVNAKNTGCGDGNLDQVSFFCFKEITYGTELILTDNGYERCNPGQWGNSEGTVRITRTGPAIPAGQVVTFQIYNGVPNVTALAPDNQWTYTVLNTPAAGPLAWVSLNNGGDQLFFMQGGTWNSGSYTGGNANHNATYDGTVLYAFTTQPINPWVPSCTGTSSDNQRSGRPSGVECFSMAPTLVSDHNKYKGLITAATQRDWINRIDETTNWASYNDCTEYNTLNYDWLSAPILPIIPGAMTNGRWRGSRDTDWFNCKNWDDARIPTATTHVVIDSDHAIRNCHVGDTQTSFATCASLLQTSAGSVPRQLNILNGSTLQVNGPLHIQRTLAGGSPVITILAAGTTLQASSVVIEGPTLGNTEAQLICKQAGCRILVEGGLTIGPGGELDLQAGVGNAGLLELGGDFINMFDQTAFKESNSTVRFIGNGDQVISVSNGEEVFSTLTANKTGGDVLLASPVYIQTVLNLSSGLIQNSASTLLTLMNNSSVINASDASFVTGPIQKIGNGNFIFPVGKGTVLRPCSLTNISGTSASAFTAEYFQENPRELFGEEVESTLDHVSACEYWMIDRSAGTANATVTLSWREPGSCGVTELSSLRVARWNGSNWLDRGNGGEVGTLMSGYIPTAATQTAFSPWTLASINSENPLPITLLNFDAQAAGAVVDLFWATASEMNNEHFTVERSADGNTFLPLLRVPGAGYSTVTLEYSAVDEAPLQGLSYYRLRQTDYDGTSTLSNVVSVRTTHLSSEPLSVHVGDGSLRAFHSFEAGSSYSILDMTGRLVSRGSATEEDVLNVPVLGMPSGAYILRMQDGERSESVRFIR